MYVLSRIKKTHVAKLQFGNRSMYFAVIDDFEPTAIKIGNNYTEATFKLKEYRGKYPGECVNIKWVN